MKGKALIIIILLCLAIPVEVFAKTLYSFPYGVFNSSTPTYKTTDKTYKNWKVSITIHLTWNISTNQDAKIRLNSTSGDYIDICFSSGGTVSIWIISSSGSAWLLSNAGKWEADKPVVITLCDGYLDAFHSNGTVWLDDFVLGEFDLNAYGGHGVTNGFTAGYVTVEVDSNIVGGVTQGIMEWLPEILVLAVILSVIGALLTKVGKRLSKTI